jgi:hypothetical protein
VRDECAAYGASQWGGVIPNRGSAQSDGPRIQVLMVLPFQVFGFRLRVAGYRLGMHAAYRMSRRVRMACFLNFLLWQSLRRLIRIQGEALKFQRLKGVLGFEG